MTTDTDVEALKAKRRTFAGTPLEERFKRQLRGLDSADELPEETGDTDPEAETPEESTDPLIEGDDVEVEALEAKRDVWQNTALGPRFDALVAEHSADEAAALSSVDTDDPEAEAAALERKREVWHNTVLGDRIDERLAELTEE